jgi:hypothetical protein
MDQGRVAPPAPVPVVLPGLVGAAPVGAGAVVLAGGAALLAPDWVELAPVFVLPVWSAVLSQAARASTAKIGAILRRRIVLSLR